ncbi:MAG: nucleotidyl transferase AbiEii/AbiGii toxin family protein, partial [Saccharofermentanales bacterium]
KGGMLVAAVIGLETRATMDIDTTVRSLPLSLAVAQKVVDDIIHINVTDEVSFSVIKSADIMEEHEYPGIRFILEATLDNMRQTIKIDISTGDVITPSAVLFSYKLMFEDRSIPIWTYNLETLLGEKLETIMTRSTTNSRMRDFYDVHIILDQEGTNLKTRDLRRAFFATCEKRRSADLIPQLKLILEEVRHSTAMSKGWESYKKGSFFVGELAWNDIVDSVVSLADRMEL